MKRTMFSLASIFILVGILLISCNKEGETETEPIKEDSNSSPMIASQTFEVLENSLNRTSVGSVIASDVENDKLYYSITVESVDALIIDRDSGELKVLDSKLLDFEASENISIDVVVTDGNSQSTATITIKILDQDDGTLTNYENIFLQEFLSIAINDLNYGSDRRVNKWKQEVRVFLEGSDFTEEDKATYQSEIEKLNGFMTDGTQIRLVNTLEDSNVHLWLGPVDEIADIWPNMYEWLAPLVTATTSSLEGFEYGVVEGNEIKKAHGWLAGNGPLLFDIMMSHLMGLTWSDSCSETEEDRQSMLCRSKFVIYELSKTDKDLWRYLYHPQIEAGLDRSAAEERLFEILAGG